MNINSYILIACYCALIASPFLLRRFSRSKTDAYGSFAVGERNFGWFRITAGLSATFVGGAAVINVAGLGYTYGWSGLTDAVATSLALFLSSLFVVPRLFQRRNISLGGFLHVSGPMVNAATGLLSTVVYTLITAAQIVALIKVAQPFFPIPTPALALLATIGITTYVFWGGYSAVTVTDVIQFITVGVCYFALTGLTLLQGTVAAEPSAVAIAAKSMPLDDMIILALPLLFVPVSQDLHIRINSSQSQRDARIGVTLAGLVYLVFGIISVCVGRKLAQAGVALENPDDAVAAFLSSSFGVWSIIPTFAVICVVVSSLDSVLFASASSLSYDFWDRINRRTPEKDSAHPRIATVIVLGVALVIALQAPQILRLVLSALVIYVSVLLPMMAGRFLNRNSDTLGKLAFVALAVVTVLEAIHFAPPFRAFLYTLAHAIVVLTLRKETPHEKTG